MIGVPEFSQRPHPMGLPCESCILIKLRFVLLHCRKKACRDWAWPPLICRASGYCGSQRIKRIASKFPWENAMPLTRREAIAGGGGAALLTAFPALAQGAYPSRTIKMIVPYPAGGTTDLLGRLVAEQLKSGLNATVVVENKPGAGTTLGADQVAKSEPDGHTLLMATSTTLAINKTLYKKLSYDPVKDFAPIALVAGVPFALIINPAIPAKTLAEFIAYAKSKPGLAYGSAGNGSPQHLGAEMLKTAAGIDIRHVPYRGSIPAMLDIIAGHIPFMVVDLQPALQQIREGKVRVLGVTTPQRVAIAPDIPTIAEGGLNGYELVAWQGVVAAAGTPRPIVDQLAAQINRLIADPATRERLIAISLEPLPPSTPDSFAAYIKAEVDRWAVIVKNSGAEAE
jgi:tripartite-type tricarboxylate transporter receptor subunit TctC